MLNLSNTRPLIVIIVLYCIVLLSGCAGPLDTATRQALDLSFVGKTYLAKVYLGNRYNLDYTNNSVDGRDPTGVFIDQALNYWYETDASFFELGSSGKHYTLEQLQAIDRDLDFDTFGQGIVPGQLVVIKKISDKPDKVIVTVRTVRKHEVTKKYGVSTSSRPRSRESRIHCVFGKDGMLNFDQRGLQPMLDQLLAPAPSLVTDDEKTAFILANYPDTPLDDLAKITGYLRENVLEIYYRYVLSQSHCAQELQEKLVEVLVESHDTWYRDSGIRLQDLSVDEGALILECAIQEISDSAIYHSPELRAGLVFFDGVTLLMKSLGKALAAASVQNPDLSFQQLLVKCAYLYFDGQGQRFPETLTATIDAGDIRQFAESTITSQELANRSAILMGTTPVKISLSALAAVKNVKYKGSTTWKTVEVELWDWDYEEDEEEKMMIFEGEVRNTGTWIAEEVKITVEGYDKYGFEIRSKTITLGNLLKPGETASFTIKISTEDVKRFSKPILEWKEVE